MKDLFTTVSPIARGYVKIEDENGNVIAENHNLIVEAGRKFILNKIFGNSETRNFKSIKLGSNGASVSSEDIALNDGNPHRSELSTETDFILPLAGDSKRYAKLGIKPSSASLAKEKGLYVNDDGEYRLFADDDNLEMDLYRAFEEPDTSLVIYKEFTNVNKEIAELGLFIGEEGTTAEDETMFSHLIFEPVFLSSGRSYTLTYVIYF